MRAYQDDQQWVSAVMSSSVAHITPSITASLPTPSPLTPSQLTPVTTLPPPQVLFPAAAAVAIVIAAFLIIVLILLLVRKCVMARGAQCSTQCLASCVDPACCHDNCWECCRGLCECLDCSTPDCNVWLDRVCPSKQQCSLFCGQLWSCYCCLSCADACRDVQCCPDCSAFEYPDLNCCNCCHCTIKMPECSHISCLCFECGRPPDP